MTAKKLLYIIQEQKAEIERLKAEEEKYPFKCVMPFNSMICSKSIEDYDRLINEIEVDAIKEFVDRLKEKARTVGVDEMYDGQPMYVSVETIDKLVKEMVGEE